MVPYSSFEKTFPPYPMQQLPMVLFIYTISLSLSSLLTALRFPQFSSSSPNSLFSKSILVSIRDGGKEDDVKTEYIRRLLLIN